VRALFLESLPFGSSFKVGSHHYASRLLSGGWEGMWLSQPISPLHFVRPTRRELDERVAAWRQGPVRMGAMRYYSPFTLLPTANVPLLRSSFVSRRSSLATVPPVSRVLAEEGFAAPDLVWLTNPVYQPLAARMARGCLAVRVADDHMRFRDVPPAIQRLEDAAIRDADVVFAVAGSVYERLAASRQGVVRLPNGVDAAHFETPRDEPADIASLPHPRVVYVGALEYWFDVDLLERSVRANTEASFVVIGPHGDGRVAALASRLPNLHTLGPRPYEHVPAYLQHCDVGIVPFARDALVDSIHPIKVYEYLAAGLPVVSVRWAELESMQAPVMLAERGEFVERLEAALAEGSDRAGSRHARLAYARANSWDARYSVVEREIARVLEGGERGA
jgi:glycosyltransferase involved in cell wall biosynthesis